MHELTIVDESFDLKFASEYHLSIQAGLDGFSFCVLHCSQNKFVVLQHIPFSAANYSFLARKIETVFEQEPKITAAYQSVSVALSTDKATLTPKVFSDKSLLKSAANLAFELTRNEDILTRDLPGLNQQISFCYPKDLLALFSRKFNEFNITHLAVSNLLSALLQRDETRNALLVHFGKKNINLIALQGSQIALFNSFYFKNESDFLYHTLNCCTKIQFDPQIDEMLVSGFVADDSSYIKQLKKYIGNVYFLKPPAEYRYSNIFEKVQKHQFVNLFTSGPCE